MVQHTHRSRRTSIARSPLARGGAGGALALLLAACQQLETTPLEPALLQLPPVELPLAVSDLELDLGIDIAQRTLSGTASYTLTAIEAGLSEVELQLVGMDPLWEGLEPGGAPERAELRIEGGRTLLLIQPPLAAGEELEVRLSYSGRPGSGVNFEGQAQLAMGAPTRVVLDAEPGASSGWLPLPVDVGRVEGARIALELPIGWTALGPGQRSIEAAAATEAPGAQVLVFEHPTALTTDRLDLHAGSFAREELSSGSVSFEFLTQDNDPNWLQPCLAESIKILDYFTYLFGVDYPQQRYTQLCLPSNDVEVVPGGALLPDSLLGDDAARRDDDGHGLIARAIARQWLGGSVTPERGHAWLDRGLSAYAALLYTETTRDADDFGLRLRDAQRRSLQLDVPLVGLGAELADPQLLEGAAIARVHLLRKSIGDDAFRDGLADYVASNRGRQVTTADFQAAMELASNSDLSDLFNDWFRQAGSPALELEWVWDSRSNEVVLGVRQTQNKASGSLPVYRAPVQIQLRAGSRTSEHRIALTEREQTFRFPLEERPTWVRFDRDAALPARVDFDRRGDEWLAIASRDLEPLGRAEAVTGLGALARETRDPRAKERYIAQLSHSAVDDESEKVRIQAASELGRVGGLAARAHLERLSGSDDSPNVRIAALEALGNFGPSPELAEIAEQRFADTYSWRARAAAAGLFAKAAPTRAQSWIASRLVIESPQQRLRAALLRELADLPGNQIDALLLDWASDREAAEQVRIAAIESLSRRSTSSQQLGQQLANLLAAPEHRVRLSVIQTLAARSDAASRDEARALEAVLRRP